MDAISSSPALLMVDPLHRGDLDGPGESQLAQSLSSTASNPSGVHENRLFLIGLGFSSAADAVCLPLGVGVDAPELGVSRPRPRPARGRDD